MDNTRSAGVLLHISSLPGKYGIGSLGKEAYRFAKRLARAGVRYWQILPLVQTGYGDSPYQSVSCSSGNPYFIDLDLLEGQGLLTKKELKPLRRKGDVDYGALYTERYQTLRTAYSRFFFDSAEFRAYVDEGTHEDYALFMTAKTVFGGSFCDWEEGIRRREPQALEKLRTDYHEEYLFWQFLQYEFDLQWKALKEYCNSLGIRIIGDIPLYVAYDSADVWAHPELFKLDGELKPAKVAGVPPDYFSETGQLWGNPVFDWAAHKKEDYRWWRARLAQALKTYDLVRIDHFRGLDRYYEIDAGEETAVNGAWQDGPKDELFEGVDLSRIIAEDLGEMDDGVRSLIRRTGLPGMKVLLFAFDGDEDNAFLPHNIHENSVCYTGTHDNDTVAGYVKSLTAEEFLLLRSRVAKELDLVGMNIRIGQTPERFAKTLTEIAMASSAGLAVVPVQDLMGLDNTCRMNHPGTNGGNWCWRLKKLPSANVFGRLKRLIRKYR